MPLTLGKELTGQRRKPIAASPPEAERPGWRLRMPRLQVGDLWGRTEWGDGVLFQETPGAHGSEDPLGLGCLCRSFAFGPASRKGLPGAGWTCLPPPAPTPLVGPLGSPRTLLPPGAQWGRGCPRADPLFSPSSDSGCSAIAKPGPNPGGENGGFSRGGTGGSTHHRSLL